MRALITDLDRTLTDETLEIHPGVLPAVARLRRAGVLAILCTGRTLDHLLAHRLHERFDAVVAENGAVVCVPVQEALEVKHSGFAQAARDALGPLARDLVWGRVVGSAPRELAQEIGDALSARGVEHALIPNANEIMILPAGVDKASGSRRALALLEAPDATTWAVGDGENDVPLLQMADHGVVAQNAHPAARAVATLQLDASYGDAFLLLVDQILGAPAEGDAPLARTRQ